jgi:hypothetical protein
MADIVVRMIFNVETGKKDILIDYDSDDDALPFEHEKRHRQVVEHLLGKGVLQPNEVGEVVVRRGGVSQDGGQPQAQPSKPEGIKQP